MFPEIFSYKSGIRHLEGFNNVCKFGDFILLLRVFLNLQKCFPLKLVLCDPQCFHGEARTTVTSTASRTTSPLQNQMTPFPPRVVVQIHDVTHTQSSEQHLPHVSALPGPQRTQLQGSPTGRGGLTVDEAPGRYQPMNEHVCSLCEADKWQSGFWIWFCKKSKIPFLLQVC